jgi:23S rRNA pseudouridine1911/1915/1917 synthase
LSYRTIQSSHGKFLLEVNPVTGRPHQIRVQLATIGSTIVGDLKYGAGVPNEDGSICLHARALEFIHPVKKELIKFEAPTPANDNWKLFST